MRAPLLALLAACTPGSSSLRAMEATVTVSESIVTVAFVTWVPPDAGESWVEYGLDETLGSSTPRVATSPLVRHEQVLLGLKADHTYWWRAVTEVRGVRHETALDTVTTGSVPLGVADAEVGVSDPSRYDPSPWLLTVINWDEYPATVVIYDREGDPVWYTAAPSDAHKTHTSRPAWDGRSILFGYWDQTFETIYGGIYRVSMDGRSGTYTPTYDSDHDFIERRDGSLAYLRLDSREAEVEGEVVPVTSNAIWEIGEGDDPAVVPPTVIFNQFDDSGQPLYWACSHMETPNLYGYHEWTHANSLIPDPDAPDDFYWVNYKNQDSLVRVDRAAGRIDWEIGGRYDDSDLTAEDAFDHGHLSQFWPGGFLMFDNNLHDPGNSRVREYAYDRATKHVALVHEWPGDLRIGGMADARRTGSGTVIIDWGAPDGIQERTDDGEVVWQLDATADGGAAGRITLLQDLYELADPYPY